MKNPRLASLHSWRTIAKFLNDEAAKTSRSQILQSHANKTATYTLRLWASQHPSQMSIGEIHVSGCEILYLPIPPKPCVENGVAVVQSSLLNAASKSLSI